MPRLTEQLHDGALRFRNHRSGERRSGCRLEVCWRGGELVEGCRLAIVFLGYLAGWLAGWLVASC